MRPISDTIARLGALRKASAEFAPSDSGRLLDFPNFGSNPGNLGARVYVPKGLSAGAPLVVVLHGCTQNASGYDIGAGWSQMADFYGFALLFPEQSKQNNANLCFNWFQQEDNRRGGGEALSIRQMIAAVTAAHPIDPARIFVTGLSAGGAMAAVMLATYPEVFAAGAIIAGLPYGCAASVPQAFELMRGHGLPHQRELAARVRSASGQTGSWPRLSVWHGDQDMTVSPVNAAALTAQWRELHGVGATPGRIEAVGAHRRLVWKNADDQEVVEEYRIAGMGHGTPLSTRGEDGCGKSGAFMLEAGISSTHHICRFWGLRPEGRVAEPRPCETEDQVGSQLLATGSLPGAGNASFVRTSPYPHEQSPSGTPEAVRTVIEDALRSAGLLR